MGNHDPKAKTIEPQSTTKTILQGPLSEVDYDMTTNPNQISQAPLLEQWIDRIIISQFQCGLKPQSQTLNPDP